MRFLTVIVVAAVVVTVSILLQRNDLRLTSAVTTTTDSCRPDEQQQRTQQVALISSVPTTKPQNILGQAGSSAAASLGSLLPLSPVYYLDVEPKEQKYLRLGTNFEGMLRPLLRRQADGADTVSEDGTLSSSLVALTSSRRKEEGVDDGKEGGGLVVLVHSDGTVAKHLPETATEAFSRALVPVTHTHSDSEAQHEALRRKLSSMRVAQLRRMLRDLETDLDGSDSSSGGRGDEGGRGCEGCVEKFHLVQRIMDLRGWNPAPSEDAVAWALAAAQDSAATRPLPHHLGIAASPEDNVAIRKSLEVAAAMKLLLDCTDPSVNGTVSCTQRRRTTSDR